MSSKPLTISGIGREAGVGVETIRYYQRLGLIEEPAKPSSGYRTYPCDTVARLRFIQRAKQLGFTLAEIGELLQLEASDCAQTQQIAQRKLDAVRAKIADLSAMASTLERLLEACRNDAGRRRCPIIDSLSRR